MKNKLAFSWGAPQDNNAKFKFAIHPQGIRQFHDNCQIAKCQIGQTVATLIGASLSVVIKLSPYSLSKKCSQQKLKAKPQTKT